MKDFTTSAYKLLLQSLKDQHYHFQTFSGLVEKPESKVIILRHDVDRIPINALRFAKIEHEYNISTSYFFRIVKHVFNENIIEEIARLGHEIGYHYEDVSLAAASLKFKVYPVKPCEAGATKLLFHRVKGSKFKRKDLEKYLVDKAIESFQKNLETLRKIAPVKTICMHGSPLSKYDNKLLWKYYDYRDYEIIGEPYFDVDYSKVLYLTDTGRRWNETRANVRDNVQSDFKNHKFKTTFDILNAIKNKQLPDKIIINTHPHRWFKPGFNWHKEYATQNVKNLVKYFIVKFRNL